jgi:integrase
VGEIDFGAALWRLPGSRTKTGKPIVLPLPSLVLDELHALIPDGAGPSWKLLGHVKGSAMVSFSRLKRAIDRDSGVRAWRLHDLRRSCRTTLGRLGIAPDIAERCLNHVTGSAVERIYNRHGYEAEVVSAMQRYQSFVLGLVGGAPTAEVVPLKHRAG